MKKHLRFWIITIDGINEHYNYNNIKRYYYLTTENYLDVIKKTKSKKSFKKLHKDFELLSINTFNKKIF